MNKQLTAPEFKELSILGKRSTHPTEEHPGYVAQKEESFELGGSGIKEAFEVSQRMRSPDSPSCALLWRWDSLLQKQLERKSRSSQEEPVTPGSACL